MIFAYAGRRSDSLPRATREHVQNRLRKLITQAEPSAVVGAAACGADLLLLEEAFRLQAIRGKPDIHVVLPTPVDRFRADSVEPDWRARFDDVIHEVRCRGELTEADGTADDVYAAGNMAIIEAATELAAGRDERAVAVVVAEPGAGAYTERFIRQAALQGIRPLRIDPSVARDAQRRCFVVMPYGEKWDPQRSFKMNCDLTYGRLLVPALEHAQLDYRRADETVDPGIVLRPMISDIAHAEVVVADLATGNFNVGWELGLRHLLKEHTTILIKPKGNSPAPFDVQALRNVEYAHDERGFSDDAVLEAWENLDTLLAEGAGESDTDSPVGALMNVQFAQIEAVPHEERVVERLRAALAEARDLRDAERVEEVIARIDALEVVDARLVLAEAGAIMRRLNRHARARELLNPVVAADHAVKRPAAHQELAMAIYQPLGATAADYRAAEEVLRNVLEHGGYPETESLLGAVAKRRARAVEGEERLRALATSRRSYLAEYERNLNDHYAGVNVIAVGTVLAIAHADAQAMSDITHLLPAVRVAAQLRLDRVPDDYWARVTLAEIELLAVITGQSAEDREMLHAYDHAGAARPLPDAIKSSLNQLEWYEAMRLDREPIHRAADALQRAAGMGA